MEILFYIVPIIIISSSVCSIIWPKTMWYLTKGWQYKNVEPSDAALMMTRVGGVVGVIGGIVFLVIASNMHSGMPAGFP
jgi:hypothetical protein